MKHRMKKKSVAKIPPCKNPAAPAARRANDLLVRMTLGEKAVQRMCVGQEQGIKAGGWRGQV